MKRQLALLTVATVSICSGMAVSVYQTETDADSPSRRTLLPEGSELLRVVGTMVNKGPGTPLEFLVPSENPEHPDFRFTLLPSRTLQEMEAVTKEHPDELIQFVMSGDLYAYRNKNYLHPRHAAYRLEDSTAKTTTPKNTEGAPEEPIDQTLSNRESPPDGQDSIDDLLAKFEQRTGTLTRSLNRDQTEETTEAAIPEGSLMHMRRGRLTRDDDGAWMFLFDADAEGLADPPVTLLPTQTLQELEGSIEQTGTASPLLLSGEILLYRNQRFLIPTLFREPKQRTFLVP